MSSGNARVGGGSQTTFDGFTLHAAIRQTTPTATKKMKSLANANSAEKPRAREMATAILKNRMVEPLTCDANDSRHMVTIWKAI